MKRLGLLFWVMLVGMQMRAGGGPVADVKVIHAEGKIFYHEIFISWSTEFERSACDFLIEASEDGKDWRIRGRIKSKGNAESHAEYNFVDVRDDHLHHYRIRKADHAGKMETLSEFSLADYSINVTLDEVVIDHEKKLLIEYRVDQDQELIVRVYNRIGEQVVTKVMPFNRAGEYIYQLDISDLKKDRYLLVVTQALLDKSVAEKAFQVVN
ncbi:MAG: hypothetical protein KA293_00955 [Bacteroidia bacterium]|nr:hypothetical protein [Bacteroidota bacterium]MBP6638830.1 hypothetical protein [Bacteroidia bacterium]